MLLEQVPQGMTILTRGFPSPGWGAQTLPLLQEVFPGAQRIDFYATAFLSLGISIELSFLLPTYFLLPRVKSVNIPDLHSLLDVDDRPRHWIGRSECAV